MTMRELQSGYLTLNHIAGDPAELLALYGRTSDRMDGVGRDHGLILNAAATTDDGLLVVNLWPSAAESKSAAGDPRRAAVVRGHGLSPSEMRYEHHQLDRVVLFDAEPAHVR
jgi:hypothetical protein